VLAAVLAGALFLDRAQRLVPVYAAAHDLPAGVPLGAGDLMVVRVRLPEEALRHYLRPSVDRPVAGRVLAAPLPRGRLAPAELLLASLDDADLVELPVQVEPGDMAEGLRPGDRVQLLAAYTEGARRGRAAVLLPAAEVVHVLEDPGGLTGQARPTGVQLRMPSASAPLVAAAIASARIFVVKGPALAAAEAPPTQAEPADPAGDPAFGDPGDPGPGDPGPDEGDTTGAAPTSTP
jgi:pilus assembly protein CpaB